MGSVKSIFLLTAYGHGAPYSTEQEAQKAAAVWLNKKVETELSKYDTYKIHAEAFKNAFQREMYAECIIIWNGFVNRHWSCNTLYMAVIKEAVIDQPF